MGEWLLSGRRGERTPRQSGEHRQGQETVHINQASPQQVVALLRLTPGEAWEILRARPLRSVDALRALLPEGHVLEHLSLELTRLSLNDAREIELIHLGGLSPAQAARLCAGRPFTSEQAVRALPTLTDVERFRLLEIFRIAESPAGDPPAVPDPGTPGFPDHPGASAALPRQQWRGRVR